MRGSRAEGYADGDLPPPRREREGDEAIESDVGGGYGGDWRLMAQGGAVALVSGLAGGALAGLLGGRRPLRHALAVLPWLLVDSTYVLFFFPRKDPLWFDLLGSLGLIAATIAGGALITAARRRSGGAPASRPAGEAQASSGQT